MQSATDRLIVFLASGAGVGYVPRFPGTAGTLIAIPLALAMNRLAAADTTLAAGILVGLILIALAIADRAARILARKDPPVIVIDEIVGFVVAGFMTDGLSGLLLAFVLFRFFDIAKVFPAAYLETLPGGAGIVLDDIMAGAYTFLLLRLLTSAGWV